MTGEGAQPRTDGGGDTRRVGPRSPRPRWQRPRWQWPRWSSQRPGWPLWLAAASLVLFLVLAALVATGVTQSADAHAIQRLRPDDEWGVSQQTWSPWMNRLDPTRMYLMLGATSVAMAVWRKSLWPVVYATVVAGVSVAATVLAKLALDRPDPHGFVSASGGSFPSGHVIAVVVCSAGCLLVVFAHARWWMWTPLLVAVGLLTSGLLVAAAHWPTDIAGGALLALALVGAVSRTGLRRRALRHRWGAP